MQKTTNLGLNKPESGDAFDIEHFNENADKIDAAISIMPSITETDEGKFARVQNGKWAAVAVPEAETAAF